MCNPLLLAVAFFLLLVIAVARSGAARALGMRGITFPFGGSIENEDAAAPWRRAVVVIAGVVASYLVPVLFFVLALRLDGTTVYTTEVGVIEGRPAAKAGMASGDRVLRVGGEPVATWEELSRKIGARAAQPTEIVVARGAEDLRFTVLPEGPPGSGKIGVTATPTRIPVSLGAALTTGVARPPKVIREWVEGLLGIISGQSENEVAGPVGMVRAVAKVASSGLASLLYLCGVLLSYVWPAAVIAAIVTVPRRKRSRGS